ncbi:MAG TPA: carboxypeptidase regulatory-like domain-containing protein [Vicinamibacterales bacterium]|nr:carboxypeptidase regulatory-like domain-containing protein [Vicinamibacterales bacterium]
MSRRFALVLLLILLPAAAFAQQFKANLAGSVTDVQGAVVPGVTVTVTNTDTNVSADTVTDSNGVFSVKDLVPGKYKVAATLSGFKTFVREGIVLHTAETATIEIKLDLGQVEETVTVSAGLSEVETNQSVLSQTMDNKKVSELPLNGRQVYMLLQLTSGTLFTQQQFGASGFSGTRAWDVNGSVTIHGSRTGNNEFLIDGASNAGTGGWTYAPPVDAIEEFKVDSASTSAQYGRTSGGVVNLTLKSGTNQLHGSGTALFRGTALDSNQIQNIRNNISNKGHKYADAEGMLSGPIVKNKTFFMGGYQGYYEEIPFPSTQTVPTALQLKGDFSQTFNAAGQLIQIFDPLTTVCNAQGVCTRQAFENNVIPRERFNAVSAAMAALMPTANAQGTITGQNNFIYSPNLGHYRYNSYLTRIDHAFSTRHKISFSNSGNWGSERRDENSLPPPALRSDNWPTQRKHYLATADDNITIGPRTLLNTRFAFDRFDEPHPKEFGPLGSTTLPFNGKYQATSEPWYPSLRIGGLPDMFAQGFRRTLNDIWTAQSTLSHTAGAHLFKTGAEFRLYRLFRQNVGNNNGQFDFSTGFTQRDPTRSDSTSGVALASFLLGYPSAGRVDINAQSDQRYSNYDVFVQDDWKLSSRATINLGLRWDYQHPVIETKNRQTVGFDITSPNPLQLPAGTINPATGQPFGTLRGGLLYAGANGASRSPYKSDWNNIQPRVGIAYKVTDWASARANYGRAYLGITACCGGVQQDGFSQTTNIITAGPLIGVPITTLDNPFPTSLFPNGFLQPIGNSLGLATTNGQGFSFRNPNFQIPYTDLWMAGVNMDLPWNVGFDAAYVGNKVSKLPVTRNINPEPLSERVKAIVRLGGTATYLSTQLPNPFAGLIPGTGLNTATVSRQNLLRPFPQFAGAINEDFNNIGYSTYRALEMTVNRRLAHDVAAYLTYTWSRRRQATDLLNIWDEKVFEDIDPNDRPQRVTITALWGLPFGPGKPLGGNTSGVVARLIEGWQFNVIGEISSGTPINMNSAAIPLQDHFALPSGQQTLAKWFDNSTKTNPRPDGTYAWDVIGANDFRVSRLRFPDVRQDSKPVWSISLFKNTRAGGARTLQFRAEVFNVLNTRLYNGPNTDPTSANFGVVSNSQINFPRQGQIGLRLMF